MKHTFSAALLLSALAPFSVRADIRAVKRLVREELEKTNSLTLQSNDHFYSLGEHGEAHEEKMAVQYADFVNANEGHHFLFLPGVTGTQTPRIDGTVFDQDPTHPLKRVSFKTLQIATHPNPPRRLAFLVIEASLKARESSDFHKVFKYIFPSDTALQNWMKRISLMAAMGLREGQPSPDVVVVDLQPAWTDSQMQELIASLKDELPKAFKELPKQRRNVPDEVVLFSGNKIYPLKKGLDYSDCNFELVE